MECPACGLFNPPKSVRCDCGYEFVSTASLRIGPGGEVIDDSAVARKREVKTFIYKKRFGTYMIDAGGWKPKTMDDHVAEMLAGGWEMLQNHSGGGNINVGRTALRVAALGLPALLFGASRQAETISITFVRSAEK